MIRFHQNRYVMDVDNITYVIEKRFMSRPSRHILVVNGHEILSTDILSEKYPELFNIIATVLNPQDIAKPLVLWSRFLAYSVYVDPQYPSINIHSNLMVMNPQEYVWFGNKGLELQSQPNKKYLSIKVRKNIPFTPQEIIMLSKILPFEKVFLDLLYKRSAAMDMDCNILLLNDFLKGDVSLSQFQHLYYYLVIGNIDCSLEQYVRWKDKTLHSDDYQLFL